MIKVIHGDSKEILKTLEIDEVYIEIIKNRIK